MLISKILNNNAAEVLSPEGKQIVVMGKGICFKKKAGDEIEESGVDKIFVLRNEEVREKLMDLMEEIPMEYFHISEKIIQKTKQALNTDLNENIYITLTDHLHFAVERYRKKMQIKNGLLWEIKKLYPTQFGLGLEALAYINEKFQIKLPEDEAGFITMHILTAQMNENMGNVMDITKIVTDMINIVKYHFSVELNEDVLDYQRFIRHVQFLAERIVNKEVSRNSRYGDIYQGFKEKFAESDRCVQQIKNYMQKNYTYQLSMDEMMYLTIHIQRIIDESVQDTGENNNE